AVTQRIIAHVTRGWPRLGEPIVRHRGRYCYVSALLPGHREPTPILRLRYQGSADRWAIGIYLASTGHYTESELPTSFGPKTGTPEEGVDDTFILYAGLKTGHLRPSARTGAQATKVRNTRYLCAGLYVTNGRGDRKFIAFVSGAPDRRILATGRRSPALFAPRASDPARGRSPQPPARVPAVSRVIAQPGTYTPRRR